MSGVTLCASYSLLSVFAPKTSYQVTTRRSLWRLIGLVIRCKTMDGKGVGQS